MIQDIYTFSNLNQILPWLGYPISFVLGLAILYLITHPETAEKWGAILCKLGAYISTRAEKKHIALDVQSIVNSFKKETDREVENLLPYGIKIDWVGEEITPESFISEGVVVIRLGLHKNRDENLIRVLKEYLSQTLVPEIKPHLSESVKKAIDFAVMSKILKKAPSARNRFLENEYKPEIDRNQEIKDYCEMMEVLDQQGRFTRIFLRELKDLEGRLSGSLPKDKVDKEIREFLEFLYRIETKGEQDVPLDFVGEYIKTQIVLVARPETTDIKPHKKRIKDNISKGIRSFYLLARGSNIEWVKMLARDVDSGKMLEKLIK